MGKFERIKARWRDKVIEGLKLESPYEDIVVIKLDNGYNIGIRKDELFIISKEEIKDTEVKIEKNEKLEVKEKEKNEKHIAIIGLGGTIASKVDYKTGAVYPTITASDLKAEFPDLENCDVYQLFNIFSEEMQPYHWEQIAEQTFKLLRNYDGLILLHGTDTMHYTSAALSFAIKTDKPIILVGAQRSSDRPSSDNKVNLLNAHFAAQQDFGEVTVCMHSSLNDYSCYIHRGTKVRKMHSSRRDAFKSININPLAVVNYKASYFKWIEKPYKGQGLELNNGFHDNVALIYYHPGMKESFIKKLYEYDGVVIAGTGLGHVSLKLKEALKELIKNGTFVYMTTQTLYGRVNMNVYSTGRELQNIGVKGNFNDMLPEVAYVKLCWVMKREKNHDRIAEIMDKNIANEISERIEN